jgi:ABC-type dipeptide/oligopeptide/nickel transport system permease component
VLEVIRLDHVTTARAKGLSEASVTLHHVVRNAMIPVVTLVALQMPASSAAPSSPSRSSACPASARC